MSYDKPIHCKVVRMPSALTYRSCLLLIVNIYWFLVQERPGQARHHITDRRVINFLVETKGCDISGRVIECPTLAICGNFIAVFVLFSPPIRWVLRQYWFPLISKYYKYRVFYIYKMRRWDREIEKERKREREAENSDMSIIKINDQIWPIWQETQTETCKVQLPVIPTTLYTASQNTDYRCRCHMPPQCTGRLEGVPKEGFIFQDHSIRV